jgi:hypothetical protein
VRNAVTAELDIRAAVSDGTLEVKPAKSGQRFKKPAYFFMIRYRRALPSVWSSFLI